MHEFCKEILDCFFHQVLFGSFTPQNRIFFINIIIILFFTCKVHIKFLPFVANITCSEWMLLHIFIVQLFNKSLNYIEGYTHILDSILVFLILSVKFNYFFIKKFKPSLQNMTVWKIRDPFLCVFI